MNGHPPPVGIARRAVERWRQGERQRFDDEIAEEVPVAFVYNGRTVRGDDGDPGGSD